MMTGMRTTSQARPKWITLGPMKDGVRAAIEPEDLEKRRDTLYFTISACSLFLPLFFYTWWRGEPLHVLHHTDERLHYALVQTFASGSFPMDGKDYSSATTPLFHLTLALVDVITGGNRWFLRGFNLTITLLLAILVFRDVRRIGGRLNAWLIGWALLASPYIGSRGMVLLTENYSYLWFWLAARPWFLSRAMPTTRSILLSAGFLGLAALTRQNWLWACPWMMAMLIARHRSPWRRGFSYALAYLFPIAVCLPYFVVWRGLVPQIWHGVNQSDSLHLKAIAYAFVLLGLYVIILSPSHVLRKRSVKGVALSLMAATLLGVASQLHHESLFLDSGFVWFASDHFPTFAGANSLLVLLSALGLLELGDALGRDRLEYACYLALFAASFAHVRLCFQKYYEFPLLLALLMSTVRFPLCRSDRIGRFVWIALGIAYLFSKISKLEAPLLGGA